MTDRTRKTFLGGVLTVAVVAAVFAVAADGPKRPDADGKPAAKAKTFRVGRLADKDLEESSGIVASRKHPGVFWSHNDSGNKPELFAVAADGKAIRKYAVAAKNDDWEDIALSDDGRLLIADVGNNNLDRREVYVHAVDEPDPAAEPARREPPLKVAATWTLTYPGDPFDAESLCVRGNVGYVVSKLRNYARAGLYAFDLDPAKPAQKLRHVGDLPVRFPATAADVSPDGRWLAVMTLGGPVLLRIDGDVAKSLTAEPKLVPLAAANMEACTFVPEGLLATNEGRDVLLFKWKDFGIAEGDAAGKKE